ncbi:hypothetical protein [Alkalihalobacillus pseudalcaliphilus]|uniref:hypothetical protein n=1 Tax=Alkalihalobacillus pseudalcaliphilus TaxID=79884 RepID=UPI00069E6EA9|nr:hypothetical protein [Alkalihalobacillus pseudalcaliphilus]
MPILLWNLCFLTVLTFICMFFVSKNKISLSRSTKHLHIVIMALCMMAGLAFGLTFGLLFGHDLVLSTMVACTVGLSIGFLVGKDFESFCILCGTVEGVMGGMMGAMTGMMVHQFNSAKWLLLYFDILFIIVVISIIITIHKAKAI